MRERTTQQYHRADRLILFELLHALVAEEPLEDNDWGSVCIHCRAKWDIGQEDPLIHLDSCPWRQAKNYLTEGRR